MVLKQNFFDANSLSGGAVFTLPVSVFSSGDVIPSGVLLPLPKGGGDQFLQVVSDFFLLGGVLDKPLLPRAFGAASCSAWPAMTPSSPVRKSPPQAQQGPRP